MPNKTNSKKINNAKKWVSKNTTGRLPYLPAIVNVSNAYGGPSLGSFTVEMLTTYGDLGFVGHVLNIPELMNAFFEECDTCEPIKVLDPSSGKRNKKMEWLGIPCDDCNATGRVKRDFCDSCNGYGGFECELCDDGIVVSSNANKQYIWAELPPEVCEGPLYALFDEDGVPHAVWYEGPCLKEDGYGCEGTRECVYCSDPKSKYVYREAFCTKCFNSETCINCFPQSFNLHHVQVKNGKPIGVRMMKALLDYLERRVSAAAMAGFTIGKVFIYTIDPKNPDREIVHPFTIRSKRKPVDRDSYLRKSKDEVDGMIDAMAQ